MRHILYVAIVSSMISLGCSGQQPAPAPQPQAAVFSAQISPEQLPELAQQGFRSVINNRPDFEGGDSQPTSAAIGAAAQASGLQYVYQPVVSGQITPADVEAFAQHYNALPKPVLMFCRSGSRASSLYQLAQARQLIQP